MKNLEEPILIVVFLILFSFSAIFTFFLINYGLINDFYTAEEIRKMSILVVISGSITYLCFLFADRSSV